VLAGFGEAMVIVTQRELGLLFEGSWLSFSFAMTNVFFGKMGLTLEFRFLGNLGTQ
jgi:hypothetical protein